MKLTDKIAIRHNQLYLKLSYIMPVIDFFQRLFCQHEWTTTRRSQRMYCLHCDKSRKDKKIILK